CGQPLQGRPEQAPTRQGEIKKTYRESRRARGPPPEQGQQGQPEDGGQEEELQGQNAGAPGDQAHQGTGEQRQAGPGYGLDRYLLEASTGPKQQEHGQSRDQHPALGRYWGVHRSEEHTSELQS